MSVEWKVNDRKIVGATSLNLFVKVLLESREVLRLEISTSRQERFAFLLSLVILVRFSDLCLRSSLLLSGTPTIAGPRVAFKDRFMVIVFLSIFV